MAAKSTNSLSDFSDGRPMEAIGRTNSSNSLTGESSSASRVKINGMFVGGVRGMSGAIKMERSEHERLKYPDRINLDRKGLHGVPILADEPDLRLISLQHNSIKRIQHLDTTFRLVFLDLYHNRLEQISGLEPLTNLRVLMLGKNRIRRIEGLQRCCRLSVLDLHGNRINQIGGLDNLAELKVLNLAGNQIRKICNLQGLVSLEELNIRRNRIRSTAGLEVVPTLEKLFISNNELQTVTSLSKLECLAKLHTIQMEGNPVWSSSEYSHYVVSALPYLKVLDQQEISSDLRSNAAKWRSTQNLGPFQPPLIANVSSLTKNHLMKKLEERNVCISNAKQRWNFIKKSTFIRPQEEDADPTKHVDQEEALFDHPPRITSNHHLQDGEENSDGDLSSSMMTTTETDCTISPTISHFQFPIERQASKSSLLSMKLTLPNSGPGSPSSSSQRSVAYSCKSGSDSEGKHHHTAQSQQPPNAPSFAGPSDIKKKFPGLERRKFTLPQKFVSLQSIDMEAQLQNEVKHSGNAGSNKIGFFHLHHATDDASSSDEEYSGGGLHSDSSSDSTTSESDDGIVFPSGGDKRRPVSRTKKSALGNGADLDRRRRNLPAKRVRTARTVSTSGLPSTSNLMPCGERTSDRNLAGQLGGSQMTGCNTSEAGEQSTRPPIWCRSRSPKLPNQGGNASLLSSADTGRTVEQGRDFLIELDGDLVNVFGPQALKFLDRPWNRQRSLKATTIQFNFVSFDDLVPYLCRIKQTFPNLVNFEFLETDIRSMGQLNALAIVQGISSLIIGKEGNPITNKAFNSTLDWRMYAIYRLEHWGLSSLNNAEVTDGEILDANRIFGSLGELAVMVLPQSQINSLIKKLDIGGNVKDQDPCIDYMATVKDGSLREILAKEILTYDPPINKSGDVNPSNAKLEQLLKGAHASFHKIGRLDDEWPCILPILIKRIVLQYSDIGRYKKESLCRLEKPK